MILNLFQFLLGLINRVLILFGFRNQNEFAGIIYDSATKQPLDPVIVKLVDAKSGKVMQMGITDMFGHYGFLAWPGKYKILAKKTNYFFPSQKINGNNNGVYGNLYHGEFFEILGDAEVVSFSIPMDPQNYDWNQQAKIGVVKRSPNFEHILSIAVITVFWISFLIVLACVIFYKIELANWLLIFFVAILLLSWIAPKPRIWGRVLDKKTKQPVTGATLELHNAIMPSVIICRTDTFEEGKFFLKAPKGNYLLVIKQEMENGQNVELAQLKANIGSSGVVNKDFWI